MANDLVAKLGVDASGWDAGFQRARGSMASFAGGISSLVAPIAGTLAGIWGAKESVGAFKESIESQRKLAAVFQATGGAAGLSTEQVSEFAAQMQRLTNFEDDATVASAAVLGAFTNIKGDQFTGALTAAMNMSTVMGGDLKSNVETLGKALNDPAEGMAKLARSGVQFSEAEQQKITALQESGDLIGAQEAMLSGLESRFGGAAQAVADPWKQLKNTFGDIAENIGSLLLPSINVLSEGMNKLLGPVAGAGAAFLEFGIEAAVVLENIGGLFQLAGTNAALFAAGLVADFGHFFAEVVPAYLGWFQENWQQIFVTAGANALTVFENLGTNIAGAWTSILEFFKTGKLEFNWKSLTDGFVNTVKELPNIPKRGLTELEKELAATSNKLAEELGDNMEKSRDKFRAMFDSKPIIPPGGTTGDDETGGKKKGAAQAPKLVNNAALEGSAEAASVMLRGIVQSESNSTPVNTGKNKSEADAKEQREQSTDYLRQINEHVKKLSEEGTMLIAGDFGGTFS